jgi:hypothetical protein
MIRIEAISMRRVFPALILLASAISASAPQSAPGKEAFDAFAAQRKRMRDEVCLNTEAENTQSNFEIYLRATRALLALKNPGESAGPPVNGPTGTPLTREQQRQQLDNVEAAWHDYSKSACDAAYDLYKGGSIAPVIEIDCQQRLLRSHLRDLEALYGNYFSR